MQKRFEDTIKKLSTERDAKKAQHATAIKAIETKKVNAEKRVEEDKAAKEQLEKDKIDSQMPDALEPVIVQNDAMDIES